MLIWNISLSSYKILNSVNIIEIFVKYQILGASYGAEPGGQIFIENKRAVSLGRFE